MVTVFMIYEHCGWISILFLFICSKKCTYLMTSSPKMPLHITNLNLQKSAGSLMDQNQASLINLFFTSLFFPHFRFIYTHTLSLSSFLSFSCICLLNSFPSHPFLSDMVIWGHVTLFQVRHNIIFDLLLGVKSSQFLVFFSIIEIWFCS